MVLRMSTLFLRTLREDPADAEVPSHKLLVRAGYVRRVAPGIYSWLPLGVRMLERVSRVVREEMDAIGAQEVLFPALLPREHYEASGRWTEYGDLLFRLKDRKGNDYLLGPTHEELFTTLVRSEYSSYKDLPVSLYQIQTKYRDEARPRAGILRGREFLMKDSYSFDLDDEGLQRSYDAHRAAYVRIFSRLGLDYRTVSAVSGAMGGSASEEFLAVAPTGEDTYVSCTKCDYAANTEAVSVAPPAPRDVADLPALEVLDTPDTPTIDTLVALLQDLGYDIDGGNTLKNVVVKLRTPGQADSEILVVGVPGDREIDMKRLEANLHPAEVLPFEAEDFAKNPGLVRGYIGPQVLAEAKIRYLVDPRITTGTSWVTGANVEGKHAVNVVAGRDFVPDGTIEAAEVRAGDPCPRCSEPLEINRGIEIGHIFQLGRKFADAFSLDVLGADGKPIRVTMGSYGIGVSRAIAAIAEQTYDDRGLCWPASVAPADVHVVAVGKDPVALEAAERVASALAGAGREVLLDDRGVSAGVAFADADLLGVPTIVIAGKAVKDGQVEVKDRRTGERRLVGIDDVASAVAG
ncbi:MAG TPA: proline--tRNA ligase [Mycobacteriales bacterium]|nr:proline--tRNA ligase [Mycobacteriales bacterium]